MDDAKKRRLATATGYDDDDGPLRKKAAMLADRDPPVNGDVSSANPPDEGLEAFRKEAIWRQMAEYRRQCERAVERESALNDKLKEAEARALSVEACWNTLLNDARHLAPSDIEDLPQEQQEGTALATPLSALQRALDTRYRQTKQLFAYLSSSAPSTSRQGSELEDLRARCHQLSAEAASARASVAALDSRLATTQAELEAQHGRLLAAEKRLDRAQSRTVRELESRADKKAAPASPPPEPAVEEPRSQADAGQAVKAEGVELGATLTAHAVPVDEAELAELKDQTARRGVEIQSLYTTRASLTRALDELKVKLADLPENAISESTAFQRLQARATKLEADLERARYDHETARNELEGVRNQQSDWRDAVQKDVSAQLDDATKRIAKHESDLSRVRAQREEFKAEILELKSRDSEKLRQVDQIRTLANSRQDCITAMGSEVRRLKMLVRANEGDMDMVETLAIGDEEAQLKELGRKLKDAENIAIALRDQLKGYSSTSGSIETAAIVRSETAAREELNRVKERLARYDQLFSVADDAAPETTRMAKAAEKREDRIKVLEANVKARDLSMDMLIQEVERLSSAWATLDEQNRDKVLALVSFEEKMTRLTSEKAKADNRYFAAMRAKEALQTETTVHQKTAASQHKVIETMNEARTSLMARLTATEKEVGLHLTNNRAYQDRISELEGAVTEKDLEVQSKERQLNEVQSLLSERTAHGEGDAASVRQLQEQVAKLERELAVAKTSSKAAHRRGGADEELKQHNDDLTKMLKCTSCNLRFKTHVITRCYHLLCKECIEGRINNRQRKCPTCAAPFGAQDYQQVYF